MDILNWLKSRKSKPGATSGERIGESILQSERLKYGLPAQRKAWLIDMDGTKHLHDLDVLKEGPSKEVFITAYSKDGVPEKKTYEYDKVAENHLIYYQIA